MACDTYTVKEGADVMARGMSLDTALIFVKALMLEWWGEDRIAITIQRENRNQNSLENLRQNKRESIEWMKQEADK